MRENRTYGSAGVCGSNGAFYLLPERGRAEPTNRQSTNGSRSPQPESTEGQVGAERKGGKGKRATTSNGEARFVDWNRRMRKTARMVV